MSDTKATSQAKAAAARANGTLSKGPATPEGKQASSMNAVKHGLSARTPLLPGEDIDAFNALAASYAKRFPCADEAEEYLLQEVVISAWRIHRFINAEPELIALRAKQLKVARELKAKYKEYTPGLFFSYTVREFATDGVDVLEKLLRYTTRGRRQYEQSLRDLKQMQAARRPRQNEPTDPATGLPLNQTESDTSGHSKPFLMRPAA